MSTINQGILGGFSGRTGAVVGSSWRGIAIMRARPQIKKNRQATANQLVQREKFGLMAMFLSGLREMFAVTFKHQANGMTGLNAALSLNIRNAIAGTETPFTIDYSLLEFTYANSSMLNAKTPIALSIPGNKVKFIWGDNTGTGRTRISDRAVVVFFSSITKQCFWMESTAIRSMETLTADLSFFAGETVESWIFFISEDKTACSKTVYTGPVILIP